MEKSLPPIPAKRYFTIGEVGDLCGVKPHVLRYWEQEFTQLRPMKRRGNRRYYQHHEVLMIRRIRDLLYDQGFTISMAERPTSVDIVTLPYPGFPTDLQPQVIAMNSIASGAALVTENLFEARFRFVQELSRLGADVRTDGHHALIRGKSELSGAPVEATDIRAGAGLVLAGLVAKGETIVYGVSHIDRGYAGFVDVLQKLGADIARVAERTTSISRIIPSHSILERCPSAPHRRGDRAPQSG